MAPPSSISFNSVEFGKMIRKKRKELNYTSEKLSEDCNLCDRSLRNIELGKSTPKLDTAMRIMNVLQIEPEILSKYIISEESTADE